MEKIDPYGQLEAVPDHDYVMLATKCGLPKATTKRDEVIANITRRNKAMKKTKSVPIPT